MAGRSIGTVFAEIDLDASRFTKAQQRLYRDATSTSLSIEETFKKLGIRSSAEFDLMRAKIQNSYDMIRNSAQATANDIVRAEQAKTAQLNALNEQQFGRQIGLLEKLKANWLATTAAITAAIYTMRKAWDLAGEAADFRERIEALDALGAKADMTGQQIIKAMQDAARGLLSMKEAADISARALNLSLSPEQMVEFTRVAERLTDVIGGTIPESFDRMTVAAASGRTQTLAQMGILVDLDKAYKDYALSVGRARETLSAQEEQQIRLNVILAEAKKRIADLGPATDSTRDHMDRFIAQLRDLRLELGEKLLVAAQKVFAAFQLIASGGYTVNSVVTSMIARFAELNAWATAKLGLEAQADALRNFAQEMQAASDAFDERARNLAEMAWGNLAGGTGPEAIPGRRKRLDLSDAESQTLSRTLSSKERTDPYLEAFEAQRKVLEEAGTLGAKFLMDQEKQRQAAADELLKIEGQITEGFIKSWVARIEAQQDLDMKAAQDEAKRLTESAAERERIQEQITQADIRAWVDRIEQQAALDFKAAEEEADRLQTLAKARTDAALALRKEFTSVFDNISDGITAAVRGVQQGTQTMEQAFRNMGQNIVLSIQETIIKRGINAIAESLANLAFGTAATKSSPASSGLLGGLVAGVGKLFGFAEGGIVPGPIGRPQLAVVHGGEEVIPATKRDSGPTTNITQVFAPQVGVAEAVRRELWSMMPAIKRETTSAVLEARTKGGAMARAMGARR